MPKRLVPLTINTPGRLGLNTQQSGSLLPVGWATRLMNAVYDDLGRVSSRRGSRRLTATTIAAPVKSIHEYIDASGAKLNIFAAANKIYKEVSGTITDISGSITTPTDDNWKFQNFNDLCVGYQEGHAPVVLATVGGTFVDENGTMRAGSTCLSAYGRVWTVTDSTLHYTDLLIHDYAGGSTGTFNLSNYWPNGMDTAVALADFNGFLVVFGKESMIIYQSADDVSSMSIYEGIKGIGCIARDSVQVIGKDLVFLSSTGLRSLGRSLESENMPISDLSTNIRDELIVSVKAETDLSVIKSAFNRDDGFYILSLPARGASFVFDLKAPNSDGSWKVCEWDFAPTALNYTEGFKMLMGSGTNYLTQYSDNCDSLDNAGNNGSPYQLDYEGVWNDFGEEVGNFIKIPKQVSVLGAGTAGSAVTFKWAMDYSATFKNRTLVFNLGAPSQYGTAAWGVDTYSSVSGFERVKSQLSSTGQVMKSGMIVTINGTSFALQRIDILAKLGKLGI